MKGRCCNRIGIPGTKDTSKLFCELSEDRSTAESLKTDTTLVIHGSEIRHKASLKKWEAQVHTHEPGPKIFHSLQSTLLGFNQSA